MVFAFFWVFGGREGFLKMFFFFGLVVFLR